MASEAGQGIARTEQLLRAGQIDAARQTLEEAATRGEENAAFILANLLLAGQPFGRDLQQSRSWFARAARSGDDRALDSWIAFTANGTGGERDWTAALALLEQHADRIPDYARQLDLLDAMKLDTGGNPQAQSVSEPFTEWSGAQRFPGFLSAQECRYLIDSAEAAFRPSMVIDNRTGQFTPDPIRRSDVAPFPLADERPVIHAINRRIAHASGTGIAQGEPLQILRYAVGQEYRQHHDAIPNADNQRILTFLIYLNEDFEGGETAFPKVGLQFRGKSGDALMFSNVVDGQPDPLAIHIGMPVTGGTKFLASRWLREAPLKLTL